MGLYMAVIPTRGEVEAGKKRFCGHGGGRRRWCGCWVCWCGCGGGVGGVPGLQPYKLQGCKVASLTTFKEYLCTCFVVV